MDEQAVKRIQSDPNYIKLVAERKSFGWTLAIITLVIYYGYIALVAFAPGVIAIKRRRARSPSASFSASRSSSLRSC